MNIFLSSTFFLHAVFLFVSFTPPPPPPPQKKKRIQSIKQANNPEKKTKTKTITTTTKNNSNNNNHNHNNKRRFDVDTGRK